ncbi:serine/threonine protein kinase, CMGC [Amphichorda felina]
MNGDQPTDEQKPPLASPTNSTNGSNLMAKKRKKEGLKPIITNEGGSQQQTFGSFWSQKELEWASWNGRLVSPAPNQPPDLARWLFLCSNRGAGGGARAGLPGSR